MRTSVFFANISADTAEKEQQFAELFKKKLATFAKKIATQDEPGPEPLRGRGGAVGGGAEGREDQGQRTR